MEEKVVGIDKLEPEIEEYLAFINDTDQVGLNIVTPERVMKNFEAVGEALNTLIVYPDLLIDLITPEGNSFKLGFDQRIYLRCFSRYKQTFLVATRGASKSWSAFLSRYLAAMSIPNHWSFVCADVKAQAANITEQTVINDLWVKFPFLKSEMKKVPDPSGKKPKDPYVNSGANVQFNFTGGGTFEVCGIDSIRGTRKHSGIIEEMIEQDPIKVNEKVLPTMNIARRTLKGELNENEPHAAKIFITSAGYAGTYAYGKFIETLCLSIIDPDNYCILSSDWRLPVKLGRLGMGVVRDALTDATYSQESFDREFGSIWSNTIVGAAFKHNVVVNARKVVRADRYYQPKNDKEFYVVVADMAKDGEADTAIVVLKVSPLEHNFLYKEVNAFKVNTSDYKEVSDILKKTVLRYKARMLVYDANGVGASLRDWLTRDSTDKEGLFLPGIGIINPPKTVANDIQKYSKDRTIAYELKASSNLNNDINKLFFGRLAVGAIKLLISAPKALDLFKNKPSFNRKTLKEQAELMQPYNITDLIEEQLLNLDVKDGGDAANPVLRVTQRNSKIQKDFYSALSYGVYAVHIEYELKYYNKKKTKSLADAVFISL